MKPVLTAEASAQLDAAHADQLGTLMDRAGYAVAINAVDMGFGYGSRISILAGPGNNGGDGYVAATELRRRGAAVTVFQLEEPRTDIAREAAERAHLGGVPVRGWIDHPIESDLIIDALFGGGFRGDIPVGVGVWSTTDRPVLSVDIPSGVNASTGAATDGAFGATRTVTFHALKVGHCIGPGAELCGEVVVAEIGLRGGDAAFWIAEAADAPRPARAGHAHKWSSGAVAVAGGSPGMGGAALLSARSALAAGAGAALVSSTADLVDTYRAAPELLTAVRADGAAGADDFLAQAERFDAVVVGPGLAEGNDAFIERVVAEASQVLILDAGGLAATTIEQLAERTGPTVLTPHGGEFERLAGVGASYQAAADLAGRTGAVVLLKGGPTFVASDAGIAAVTTGGPELATIGTGDVLAGALAALAARGLDPKTAATSAAYWHGHAGAALAATGTVTADRLVDELRKWVW